MFNEVQKNVLNLLLDKYEKSKTYLGENKVAQNFCIRPEEIWKNYKSDYADTDLIYDFENQICELEKKELVFVKWKARVIDKIESKPEKWEEYYHILQRQDKHTLQKIQIDLYESYLEKHPILREFCKEQINRLNANKKANYEITDAECILKLCTYILDNQKDILERELSIAVLGDSKLWEKKYRSRVCRVLRQYGDFEKILMGISDTEDEEDKREIEKIILEEYHVYSNPTYVYFKGNARFYFDDEQQIKVRTHIPMAFSIETLKHIKYVEVFDEKVVTVENLTSFNRAEAVNTFYIFLSGYHNSAKQKLIQNIYNMNSELAWYHFGDIDPDGFYIIENLKKGTGIPFEPIYMNISILEKYKKFTKKLTNNDRRKATNLLKNKMYHDVMEYMLNTGVKLEQEIVSWMESEFLQ